MGLIDNIGKTLFGFGGKQPSFNGESKTSTLHNLSSTTGNPEIVRNPSILDESDALNKNKYKNAKGRGYIDKLPK